MPLRRNLAWFGLLGRYLVLVAVLGVAATGLYATVDADDRPIVARLAVAAFVTVVLIHIFNHLRQRLEGARPSAFAQARRPQPAEAKLAAAVQRLKDEVQGGVASHRYFKDALWPRLVRLGEQEGTRERLGDMPGPRWRRRGPSLAVVAELVRRIGEGR